tara:strand:+ start:507 stop:1004 length:498 start_codon:yes stop_codon:yes gene_type:complete
MDPVSSEKMLNVAIEVSKMTPYEKDMLVKFTHWAVENNVFQQDHILTNIFKGRKEARKWSHLDASIIKFIIEALADPLYPKFNFEIFFKFAAKMKVQETQKKRDMEAAVFFGEEEDISVTAKVKELILLTEREENAPKRQALLDAAEKMWGPDHASRPPKRVYKM